MRWLMELLRRPRVMDTEQTRQVIADEVTRQLDERAARLRVLQREAELITREMGRNERERRAD